MRRKQSQPLRIMTDAPGSLGAAGTGIAELCFRRLLPVMLSVLAVAWAIQAMGQGRSAVIASEGGLFEQGAVVGYLVVAWVVALWGLAHRWSLVLAVPPRYWGWMSVILLVMAGRELDFHKRFTSGNVLKTSYYVDATIAWSEKALALLALAAITWGVVRLVRAHAPGLRQRLAARCRSTQWVVCGAVSVVISKVADKGASRLRNAGDELAGAAEVAGLFEEGLELAIPMLFLFALVSLFRTPAGAGGSMTAPASAAGGATVGTDQRPSSRAA